MRKSRRRSGIRTPWPLSMPESGATPWTCPACQRSVLELDKDSLACGETKESLESHSHDAFDTEWIDGRFSCLLVCLACKASIGVAGTYSVWEHQFYGPNGETIAEYPKRLSPRYFTEAPHLVLLPTTTPERVRRSVEGAFSLFWSDLEACGNRIRIAVEHLLTDQGVARITTVTRNGVSRRRWSTLHERLEMYRELSPDLAAMLMAAKWIGNAGSHTAELTPDDVRDGLELIGYSLAQLYDRPHDGPARIAREINRRRKPRSVRPSRHRFGHS